MVGGLPKEKRADAIRSCRRRVAVALQTGIANRFHSAGRPSVLSAEVSYVAGQPLGSIIEEILNENENAHEHERMSAEGRATAAAGG